MPLARCRGCGAGLPPPFLDLGHQPLANALVRPADAARPDPVYPLAVCYCQGCHLVQLAAHVEPERLFSRYVYFSSYSESFLAHARAMAFELKDRFALGTESRVLEVASNDGYLLRHFRELGMRVLGVEPAGNVAEVAVGRGIPTLNRFFGPALVDEVRSTLGPADVVIGNNVLAHVPDVAGFLEATRACLRPGGTAVFEFPYLGELLDRVEFDTIYHEHVFYLSVAAVRGLARRAGLELVDLSRQTVHGGSLRVFLQAGAPAPASDAAEDLARAEARAGLLDPARFEAFRDAVLRLKDELRTMLHGLKASGRSVAAYGAPAKGNTLLNFCGIGRDIVDFTVDRSPHKQGLLLPGSRIPVCAPEELVRQRPDYALILPWNIADEIVAQQRAYRERGGRFLVPVPHPREIAA